MFLVMKGTCPVLIYHFLLAKELFDEKKGKLVHKLRSEFDIIRHIKTREENIVNYSEFLKIQK